MMSRSATMAAASASTAAAVVVELAPLLVDVVVVVALMQTKSWPLFPAANPPRSVYKLSKARISYANDPCSHVLWYR